MSQSARSFTNESRVRVKTIYDYEGPEGGNPGEQFLQFKAGEYIDLTEKCESGWWKGKLKNKEGLFPPSYVEELTPRRILNIDPKKASPTIKRMHRVLKLTVTPTGGEKVEEVQKELPDEERWFSRERAKSVIGSIKGKKEKKDKAEGNGITITAQESSEIANLHKRISELEGEKATMLAEFTNSKTKLQEDFSKMQEEFSQKITYLNEMVEEKSLIIEIMKKDLEIKEQESQEIAIEMGMEIEKLTKNFAELERQLTPLQDDNGVPIHDERSAPSHPKHHNNPSSFSSSSFSSPSNDSLPAQSPLEETSVVESSTEVPPSSETASTLEVNAEVPSPLVPSLPLPSSEVPATSETTFTEVSSTVTEPPKEAIAPTDPSQSTDDITNESEDLIASLPPPSSHAQHKRFKTFHSLSELPAASSPSPAQKSSYRPHKRMPSMPRISYSPTLLSSTTWDRSGADSAGGKIPNLALSLAKLAELRPDARAPTPDPHQTVVEISELKKRIAELEEDRMRMIEEYRSKLEKEKEKVPLNQPPTPTTPTTPTPPTPTSSLSVPSSSSSSQPRPTTPTNVPPLLLGSIKKVSFLPPVPLAPTDGMEASAEEKKELLERLDNFGFLFRQNEAKSEQQANLSPIGKVNKVLDAVQTSMARYFHFVVISIKYDAIQSGKHKLCNVDASELYDQATEARIYHEDWPIFVRNKLSPPLPSPPSPPIARLRYTSLQSVPSRSSSTSLLSSFISIFKKQ